MQTTIHKGVIYDKQRSYAERPKPFSDGLGYQSVSFVGRNGLCGPFFATSGISKELEKAIASRSPVELEIGKVDIPDAGRPLVALKVDGKAYAMRPVQGPSGNARIRKGRYGTNHVASGGHCLIRRSQSRLLDPKRHSNLPEVEFPVTGEHQQCKPAVTTAALAQHGLRPLAR
jgi:hypothetical protein